MNTEQINKVREALGEFYEAAYEFGRFFKNDGFAKTGAARAKVMAAIAALSASAQSDVEKDAVATIHSYDAETGEMWVKAKKHLSIQLGEVLYLNKAERIGEWK